jgi:predicted flap endonuclease-1-like 5' DNA nuclease
MSYTITIEDREVEVQFSEPTTADKIEIAASDIEIHEQSGEPTVTELRDITNLIIQTTTDLPMWLVNEIPATEHARLAGEAENYLRDLTDTDHDLLADDLIDSFTAGGIAGVFGAPTGLFNVGVPQDTWMEDNYMNGKTDMELMLDDEKVEEVEEFSIGFEASETVRYENESEVEDNDDLTSISGVNSDNADHLRSRGYMTVEDVQSASMPELRSVSGIGKALAARIKADVGGIEG